MMDRCYGEPISHLRLERHLQGNLALLERVRVEHHLRRCEACRACFEALQSDVVVLKPLPQPLLAPAPRRIKPQLWVPAGLAAAAVAAIALWILPEISTRSPLPAARVQIKGGELALQLVREHRGERARDADRFEQGDRFAAVISCPPSARWYWQLIVRQAGEAFFPLTPSDPLICGNGIPLPGAFSLDGEDSAQICVALSSEPLSNDQLANGTLPAESACVTVEPVSARRSD